MPALRITRWPPGVPSRSADRRFCGLRLFRYVINEWSRRTRCSGVPVGKKRRRIYDTALQDDIGSSVAIEETQTAKAAVFATSAPFPDP